MYDKEIKYYNVYISVYVSESGEYKHYKTVKCYTEERAVALARDYIANKKLRFKIRIEQVCIVNGWFED